MCSLREHYSLRSQLSSGVRRNTPSGPKAALRSASQLGRDAEQLHNVNTSRVPSRGHAVNHRVVTRVARFKTTTGHLQRHFGGTACTASDPSHSGSNPPPRPMSACEQKGRALQESGTDGLALLECWRGHRKIDANSLCGVGADLSSGADEPLGRQALCIHR
jgi:hypothetical protein